MKATSGITNTRLVLIVGVATILLISASYFLISSQKNSQLQNDKNSEIVEESGEVYVPFFPCPIKSCTNAVVVYNQDKTRVIGVGFKNIPENSPLFAIVGGTYTSVSEEDETTVILTDSDGIETTYIFRGEADSEGEIVKKDEIGVYGGGTVKVPESEDEFALFITVVDTRTDNVIPLGPDVISSSLKIL